MKIHLTFFLIAIAFSSTTAQTSIYHPFPDSNVVWNVETSDVCSIGVSNRFWESNILQGDTVIGLNSYHKVYTVWSVEHWACAGYDFSHPGHYIGGLRQDTTARTVYYYGQYDTTERLLYDFNMQVGDTIRGYSLLFGCESDSIIHEEDSVLISGNYRKRWKMEFWWGPEYIIEGIGFTGGPFSGICEWWEGGPVLVCCTQDNVVLFQDSLYTTTPGQCDIFNSVRTFENKLEVGFYPNPLLTSGYFETTDYPCTISLYNVLGEKIHELKSESEKTILNREGFAPGIYFYVITFQNKLLATGKLIVE